MSNVERLSFLSIGRQFKTDQIKLSTPKDFPSVFDFDVVIIDLNVLERFYRGGYFSDPHKFNLQDDALPEFIRNITRLRRDIVQFINNGGVVFIFNPLEKMVSYAPSRELNLIGEARNPNGYLQIDFHALLGLGNGPSFQAEGDEIDAAPNSKLFQFKQIFGKKIVYKSYMDTQGWTPQLIIKRTNKAISLMRQFGEGYIFFLPEFVPDNVEDELVFLETLADIVFNLRPITNVPELPDWVGRYKFDFEEELDQVLAEESQKLEALQKSIDDLSSKISYLNSMKHMISGSGDILEDKVAEVFRTLGFEVEKGEIGRDDLIIRKLDKVAVVEVKGVRKSAAEKHAAQLEKWAANYFEQHGAIPKGILIVNAFNELPIQDRPEKAFPDQMTPYSIARGHCLITSIQLLEIWAEARVNSAKIDILVEHIFSTVGVLGDFSISKKHIRDVELVKPESHSK